MEGISKLRSVNDYRLDYLEIAIMQFETIDVS